MVSLICVLRLTLFKDLIFWLLHLVLSFMEAAPGHPSDDLSLELHVAWRSIDILLLPTHSIRHHFSIERPANDP